MNNIKAFIDGAKAISTDGWDSLKTIAQFFNYLMHPSLIVSALWHFTMAYAFWICLLVAMLSMIFYAIGFKKCAKFIPGSISLFILLKMIGSAF